MYLCPFTGPLLWAVSQCRYIHVWCTCLTLDVPHYVLPNITWGAPTSVKVIQDSGHSGQAALSFFSLSFDLSFFSSSFLPLSFSPSLLTSTQDNVFFLSSVHVVETIWILPHHSRLPWPSPGVLPLPFSCLFQPRPPDSHSRPGSSINTQVRNLPSKPQP